MAMREEWVPEAEGFDEIDDEAADEEPEGESESVEPRATRERSEPNEDARLAELSDRWRLGVCSPAEEVTYFRLLTRILRRLSLERLGLPADAARRLERDREDIIQDFLCKKLIDLNEEAQAEAVKFNHVGGLRLIFKHFVIDLGRRAGARFLEAASDRKKDEGGKNGDSDRSKDDEDSPEPETEDEEFATGLYRPRDYRARFGEVMAHYQLDHEQVYASACKVLSTWPDWALAYLEHHLYARDEPEALGALSERLAIKSFSYKLGRLGLKANGSMKEFEGTLFGQWVRELAGSPITPEDADLLSVLMDILGEAVRARAEGPKAPGGM